MQSVFYLGEGEEIQEPIVSNELLLKFVPIRKWIWPALA